MGRVRALGAILLFAGCGTSASPPLSPDAGPPPPPPLEAVEVARPELPDPALAGIEIDIPAGTLHVGSRPGIPGRRARAEADLVPVELGAFSIDRYAYPNDPSQPPRTGVTRAEAEALCAADGKRLCTELEWERACKGDDLREYAHASAFDAEQCSLDPASCASPFGVLSLGVLAAEWTSTEASPRIMRRDRTAVVRGAAPIADAADHRCGARQAVAPAAASDTIGFRCCRGAPNAIEYPEEPRRATFRDEMIDAAEIRRILATIPELAPFAPSFRPFRGNDLDRALGRGNRTRTGTNGWVLVEGVLKWSPTTGEEAWVIAGEANGSSVLAVIHPIANGRFVHGASFVLEEQPWSIVVAYTPPSPRELLWSACWGCPGEGGTITHRDDEQIVILQQ